MMLQKSASAITDVIIKNAIIVFKAAALARKKVKIMNSVYNDIEQCLSLDF